MTFGISLDIDIDMGMDKDRHKHVKKRGTLNLFRLNKKMLSSVKLPMENWFLSADAIFK